MAKGKTSPVLVFGAIALVLVLGFLVYSNYSQKVVGGDNTNPVSCSDSTGIFTVSAVSALNGGADPSSPTITCGVNGNKVKTAITSGTTTFAVGTKLDCLISETNYIDTEFKGTMKCGGLIAQVPMYYSTSDNPSITIKDPNNGGATVSNSITGGTTNLTAPSLGGTVDFDVQFQGTNTESSGDGIYVIEFPTGSSANITEVTMGTLSKTSIPQVNSLQNAGSKAVAFNVPKIDGATKKTYSVIATLGTGKDLVGGVYTNWFAKQAFVGTDGFIKTGVENSDGSAEYENTVSSNFYVD